MRHELPYTNRLEVKYGGKGIPYGGLGILREDGEANFGFKNLKGQLDRIADVPELQRDVPLRGLVEAINQAESALFSVGSTSGLSERDGHFGVHGYVEIAWDADEAVADPQTYFPLFYNFGRFLSVCKFNRRVGFLWEIDGASFMSAREEIGNVVGTTVTIFVSAGMEKTETEARISWELATQALATFLSEQMPRRGRRLCPLMELAT
jgi:hypothetical protein